MFLSFWVLGRMGSPRQRSWASIGLPSAAKKLDSCWAPFIFLLSGLLGRMAGPRPRSWARIGLPSSFLGSFVDGWAAGKSWALFILPFWAPGRALHVSFFLGSWVGWAAVKKLDSHWALFMPKHIGGPRPKARLPSYCLSGSWVGWVLLGSLHISLQSVWALR